MYTELPRSYLMLEIFTVATVIFFAGLWIINAKLRSKDKHQ